MTSIKSSVKGIEIEINGDKICEILRIPPVGACVYDTKMWPQLEGFIPSQAVSRLCGRDDASSFTKPNVVGMTMFSRILHNIVGHCFLPRGSHRDEVSYMEAFVIDSIRKERQLHIGHIIIQHMITCCKKKGKILPYGLIVTLVFQAMGINLSRKPDYEKPKPSDIINVIALQ